ncbi:MAG: efflux RND transporter permease subunit, partial [Myxococcales bacterium]|nr:efflux RND transporter permease subunit [Myxococcales bacterium]
GWSSFVGGGPESYDLGYLPDEPNASYAHMLVNTSSPADNAYVISRIYAHGFLRHPDAEVAVAALSAGGGGLPIEIRIAGADPDELARIATEVKLRLADIEGTRNVKDDWGPRSKKFVVDIDQARAQAAGVSSQDIATSLQTVLEGFRAGEFREGDTSIPILIRTRGSQQQTLSAVETVDVFSQRTGARVPLLQVARIVPEWQFSRIRRRDLDRTVTVSSDLTADGNARDVMDELTPWLDEQAASWPAGYEWSVGGDAQETAENMGAVVRYLPLSGLIILLLLVLQFNSIRKTTIVVATVPLALIGVVIGLLVFREPFGFMPFLGLISLAGIIINNAIVLLDRIDIELGLGKMPVEAVVDACLQRFRPILLATFTTVFGLIPLYVSGGEMWQGMAIGIICGLLFGTVITLVFVPCLYSLLFRVSPPATEPPTPAGAR